MSGLCTVLNHGSQVACSGRTNQLSSDTTVDGNSGCVVAMEVYRYGDVSLNTYGSGWFSVIYVANYLVHMGTC